MAFVHRALLLITVLAGSAVGQATIDAQAATSASRRLTAEAINDADLSSGRVRHGPSPVILKAEILLDRAAISPGQIDGKDGDNLRKAISAFQGLHGLKRTGRLDEKTWSELTGTTNGPVITKYEITEDDTRGPFAKEIPYDLVKMARLHHLSYTSPLALLAAKFHVNPHVLRLLNPGARFGQPGAAILVPDVGSRNNSPVAEIEVDKSTKDVRALGDKGELVAFYPATIGSKEKPAPSGRYKVRAIAHDPPYHYDPQFHFKGVHTHHKLTIAPGPNNPVGLVWIDLTKPSYGIHGTPDPSRIGKSFSHGCIRLTNWDALDLARRVRKGTPVDFLDHKE
jgi:lipoprotein-anchoring transpeptidase ErfK/SrfK